jgi:hypothetical protein
MPRLYPDPETAKILGVSIATVRRKRRSRELGYVAIGRKVYTTEDQIKDLIRRSRRDAALPLGDSEIDEQLPVKTVLAPAEKRSRIGSEYHSAPEALKRAYDLAEFESALAVLETDTAEPGDRRASPTTPRR